MLIPRSIFKISKCTDSDSTRYALCGVLLERDADGTPRAVATDGRRLVVAKWADGDKSEFPADHIDADASADGEFSAIVPAKHFDEAGKLADKTRKCHKAALRKVALNEASANGTVMLGCHDGEVGRKIEPRTLEGRFPKWRDVVPEYRTYDHKNVSDRLHDLEQTIVHELPKTTAETILAAVDALRAALDSAVCVSLDAKLLAETVKTVDETSGADSENRGVDVMVPLMDGKPIVMSKSTAEQIDVTGILMPLQRDKK